MIEIPLSCNDLAARLNRHATYVYAMKRAGYKFTHGNRTLLTDALAWLAENPEFRSIATRFEINESVVRDIVNRKTWKHVVAAFLLLTSTLAASDRHPRGIKVEQSELRPEIALDECRVPYSNSLFTDPHKDGWLGPESRRRYICGEILNLSGHRVVVVDYDLKHGNWTYEVEEVR